MTRSLGKVSRIVRPSGLQLREDVDLGLAQAQIGELGRQVVEHPVHGGLEGGDDGPICHELG